MKRNLLITTLITFIIAFILLGNYVAHDPVPKLDHDISLMIQKYHSDIMDAVMLGVSFFGELPYSLLMVVIVSMIFFKFKYRRESYFILSILLSGLIILGVKNLINRPRPTAFYVRLVEINRFQSFPSGHVMSYVVFFGFMIILMKHLPDIPKVVRKMVSYISAFYVLTIGFSRIYLGAHWFSDTIGGLLLGLICLIPLSYFYLTKR